MLRAVARIEQCQTQAQPGRGVAGEQQEGTWRYLQCPRQPTGQLSTACAALGRCDSCNFCWALKWFGSCTWWSLKVPSKWTLLFCFTSWKIASSVRTSKQQASITWVNLWCFSSVLRIQRTLNKFFYVMTQRLLLLWNSKASLLSFYV